MNFGHVCDRILWVLTAEFAVCLLLRLLYVLDEEMQLCSQRKWIQSGGLVIAICAFLLYPAKAGGILGTSSFLLMSIYLGVSTTMDILLKQVSDILHYLGLLSALLLLGGNVPDAGILWELVFYVTIQYLVFSKMYGRADVAAFIICALFISVTNRGIETFIGHMVITFGLLALVQVFRRNIASDGNLKQPVALFPYITCGFFLII